MKKNLFAVLLTASILICGAAAFADTEEVPANEAGTEVVTPIPQEQGEGVIPTLMGKEENEKIVFDYSGDLIFAGYSNDESKLLYASGVCKPTDGKITLDKENLYTVMRAYDIKNNLIFDVLFKIPEATVTPVPTVTPAPTASAEPTTVPTASPSATYNPNEFPDVYEKDVNAIQAFAVVESVTQVSVDSQTESKITYWYQGKQQSDTLSDDVNIVAAPENAQNLVNASLSSLKRGDVVYFNRNLSGKINEIAVIYQIQNSDIVNNTADFGASFEKLFSINGGVGGYSGWTVAKYGQEPAKKGTQYAFGVIARRDNNNVYLLNKTGDTNSSILVDVAENAMVYKCNMTLKSGIELTRATSIISTISNKAWNDAYGTENSIISLNDSGYNYMLARIVDGTATDVVIYTNYKK